MYIYILKKPKPVIFISSNKALTLCLSHDKHAGQVQRWEVPTYTAKCFVRGFRELEVCSSSPPPSLGEGGGGFFDLNQVLLTAGQRQENASSLQALSFPCVGKLTISEVNASPRVVSCSRTSLSNQLT